jgi:hypothetical protein
VTAVRPLFTDEDFEFATRNLLGGVFARAADVGEVLATAARIRDGNARSWIDEWTATADRLLAEGGSAASTAARSLRAANYLAAVTGVADRTGEDGLFASTWERHRQAWDAFVDATDLAVERLEIPYEGTTLPGYLFRSGGPDEPRPTLVYNNGSDGSVVGAWVRGISGALARGWTAMTFDGPGQNAALVRQGLHFRPDWEHVVTPVVGALLARSDVDPRRLALVGVSQAGYWVPGPWPPSTASPRPSPTRAWSTCPRRCSPTCRTTSCGCSTPGTGRSSTRRSRWGCGSPRASRR